METSWESEVKVTQTLSSHLGKSKSSKSFSSFSLASQGLPHFFPSRILQSLAVMMSLVFLVGATWALMAPITMAVVNALDNQIPAEGNPALSILRHFVNLWGIVAAAIILFVWGLQQAQRHDWRQEYY